jgi:hypothetical protein
MKPTFEPVILFCSGDKAPLTIDFVRETIRSARFKIFAVNSVGLFALIQPYQPVILQRWQAFTIVALCGVMAILCYLSVLIVFAKLSHRLGLRHLSTVWILFFNSLITSFAGQWVLSGFAEVPKPLVEALLVWVFHFVLFTGLEIAFVTLVLPEVLRNLSRHSSQREPDSQLFLPGPTTDGLIQPLQGADSLIIISDKVFTAKSIKLVMAEEHYVSVHTLDGETHFMRFRMRDFLAQVSEDMGFSIHRSYWVAWAAIRQVEVDKNSMTVVLDKDISLQVARGKRVEFMDKWKQRQSMSL